MTRKKATEILVHPEHGRLPARKVLQCVFAISPDGAILHHHTEEVSTSSEGGVSIYVLGASEATADRYRCQVIPPLVPSFGVVE